MLYLCCCHRVLFCFLPSIFIATFQGQIRKLFSNRQSFCWCGFICICSSLSPAPLEVIFSSASLWVHEGTLGFAASLGSSPFCPLYSHAFLLGLCADGHAPIGHVAYLLSIVRFRRSFLLSRELGDAQHVWWWSWWCFLWCLCFAWEVLLDSRVFCDCVGRS